MHEEHLLSGSSDKTLKIKHLAGTAAWQEQEKNMQRDENVHITQASYWINQNPKIKSTTEE